MRSTAQRPKVGCSITSPARSGSSVGILFFLFLLGFGLPFGRGGDDRAPPGGRGRSRYGRRRRREGGHGRRCHGAGRRLAMSGGGHGGRGLGSWRRRPGPGRGRGDSRRGGQALAPPRIERIIEAIDHVLEAVDLRPHEVAADHGDAVVAAVGEGAGSGELQLAIVLAHDPLQLEEGARRRETSRLGPGPVPRIRTREAPPKRSCRRRAARPRARSLRGTAQSPKRSPRPRSPGVRPGGDNDGSRWEPGLTPPGAA